MANKVAKHKLEGVRQDLLKGKSYRQALLNNNYSKDRANMGEHNKVIQEALRKNMKEAAKEGTTFESVRENIESIQSLAIKKKDYSTALQAGIALGKMIGAFTDKVEHSGKIDYTQAEKDEVQDKRDSVFNTTPIVN